MNKLTNIKFVEHFGPVDVAPRDFEISFYIDGRSTPLILYLTKGMKISKVLYELSKFFTRLLSHVE